MDYNTFVFNVGACPIVEYFGAFDYAVRFKFVIFLKNFAFDLLYETIFALFLPTFL